MWTEADLRLYCKLCRSGTTFFDAKGKLARKVFKDTRPILYYSLIISHPTTKKPPIAVAERFSSSQSAPTLTSFLINFLRDVLRLCQGRQSVAGLRWLRGVQRLIPALGELWLQGLRRDL